MMRHQVIQTTTHLVCGPMRIGPLFETPADDISMLTLTTVRIPIPTSFGDIVVLS